MPVESAVPEQKRQEPLQEVQVTAKTKGPKEELTPFNPRKVGHGNEDKKPSDPTKHASETVADEKSTSAAQSKQSQQINAAERRLTRSLTESSPQLKVDCTSQPEAQLVDSMKPVSEPGETDKSNKTINEKLSTRREEQQAHTSPSLQSMKFDDLQFEDDGDHNHSMRESEAIFKM